MSLAPDQPNILHLRLLDDPDTIKPKTVYWTATLSVILRQGLLYLPRMVKSTHHDLGKFKIRDFVT